MRINSDYSVTGTFTHDSNRIQEIHESINRGAETIQNDSDSITKSDPDIVQMEQADPKWKENLAKCQEIRDRIYNKRGQSPLIKPDADKADWKENLATCQAICDRIRNKRSK